MDKVIVESPYAGEIEKNIEYARRCVRDCVLRNESPIASHLLFTQPGILKDEVPDERAMGIKAGLAWLSVCDAQIFYTDRGWSSGMLLALQTALVYGNKIKIRALDAEPKIPATLDDDIKEHLKNCLD